jgi:hypothetical protein
LNANSGIGKPLSVAKGSLETMCGIEASGVIIEYGESAAGGVLKMLIVLLESARAPVAALFVPLSLTSRVEKP